MSTRTRRTNLIAYVCLLAFIIVATYAAKGCGKSYKPLGGVGESGLPAAGESAKTAERTLREGLTRIHNAAAILEAGNDGEQAKHIAVILATTADLRAVEANLGTIQATVTTEAKQYAALVKANTQAETRIKELETTKGSAALLRWLMAGGGIIGLAVAAISFGWLRSMPGVTTGLTMFALCAAGAIILQYAVYIGIVAGAIIVGYLVWEAYRQAKTNVQLVKTGELIKADPDGFAPKAREIQDKYTRSIVDWVQAQYGKVKRDIPKAFSEGNQ
jgi:hypothetical protein